MARYFGLVLIVVLTLASALAGAARAMLWEGFSRYATPFAGELPPGPPREPLAPLVVVVFVRHLSVDESRLLPALNALRERGADVLLEFAPPPNGTPPFRLPEAVTLISGAAADVHGVTGDSTTGKALPDTVFRQAARAGRAGAVIGSQAWLDLIATGSGRDELVPDDFPDRDETALTLALETLRDARNPQNMVVVEFTGFDTAPARAQAADRRLQALADALDLGRHALVVVGDGSLAASVDARDVSRAPAILAGAGIRPRSRLEAPALDLAPTLAVLTGAPFPVHAQGAVMQSILDDPNAPASLSASAAQLAAFYEAWSEVVRQPRFAAELYRAYQPRLASGPAAAYQGYVIDLNAQAEAERRARLTSERAQRAPVAAGLGLALIACAAALIGAGRWRAVLGAAAYWAAWLALFWLVRGHRPSLIAFTQADPSAFFEQIGRESLAVLLGVSALLALTTGALEDALEAATAVLSAAGLAALGVAGQQLWLYVNWGLAPSWILSDAGGLASALIALSQAAGWSLPLSPSLPTVPAPLIAGVAAMLIYVLVRRRSGRDVWMR